ncbi:MAG: DUF4097 family beta strand repeat-containing protein [Blautia sp.]|jgi:hypothetical protein
MKKFNKVCLILAAVFAVIGIGFVTAGIATGATWETFREAVYRGDFQLWPVSRVEHWMEEREHDIDEWDDEWDHHIDNIGEEIDRHMDELDHHIDEATDVDRYSNKNGASMAIDISSIQELELDLKYGDVIIEPSEDSSFRVEVENVDEDYVKWYQEGDSLKIKGDSRKLKNGQIFLYVPAGSDFHEVEIQMDAGAVTAEELVTDKLDVNIGAGVFDGGGQITARETDLEVGAGQITIDELKSDKIELDCGVGQIDLTVDGVQNDYNYEIKCGLGQITIGDDNYTALNKKKEIHTSGSQKKIEANCGMGQIDVEFTD